MINIMNTINSIRGQCSCGLHHDTAIKDIRIGSGLVHNVGEILKENSFSKNILLVADVNTLKASDGITEGLKDFNIEYKLYDFFRVATMEHVNELEELIKDKDISVLSVGSGSVNDPCRLACANQNKKLCIFATAPSYERYDRRFFPNITFTQNKTTFTKFYI